jgi:hypothetical protein
LPAQQRRGEGEQYGVVGAQKFFHRVNIGISFRALDKSAPEPL